MSDQDQNQREHEGLDVWILGSSIGSLASAVFLIRGAKMPAPRIHLFESRGAPEDGLPTTGDALSGYDHRSSCLPIVRDKYTKYLLSLVPSIACSEQTVLDNLNTSKGDVAATRLLFQGDNHLEAIDPNNFGIGWRVWMSLMNFVLKSEKSLDRKVIRDCFKAKFFSSAFWITWSSTLVSHRNIFKIIANKGEHKRFGFCPWSSAIEFRRCVQRFFHKSRSHNKSSPPDRFICDPQEDIVLPITRLLQKEGVDIHFDVTVTDIVMDQEQGCRRISAFKWIKDETETIVTVGKHSIVIATLGSSVSGSTSGTNTKPPSLELLKAEDRLDENWSLWLAFGSTLGDPYNFCTRINESRVETFTITFQSTECLDHLIKSVKAEAGSRTLIILQKSNWSINLLIPSQPLFSHQSRDMSVIWGYCSTPNHIGNYVKKAMLSCSGQEISVELAEHLKIPREFMLNNSINIPHVMPRLAAPLLTRSSGDRPKVIPKKITNLAVVGQFVEIPDETCAIVNYSICGAHAAVNRLVGLQEL
ncbi:oleate hydratase [Penicillium cosmopolitanum]|uniref:Oleate hydratase n=1 Tax=Penicillium cosmopolitanum TaxID=1131564 RepID=A0A9X0B8U5_9EURO|nr:oleate hydratase [Penicillium cosmopolitanum]KAJ5392434.1 oleate hydratase [Penicillium cosmopolitanum]